MAIDSVVAASIVPVIAVLKVVVPTVVVAVFPTVRLDLSDLEVPVPSALSDIPLLCDAFLLPLVRILYVFLYLRA